LTGTCPPIIRPHWSACWAGRCALHFSAKRSGSWPAQRWPICLC